MTSDQIRIEYLNGEPKRDALWEIAYQLAVMNEKHAEREAEKRYVEGFQNGQQLAQRSGSPVRADSDTEVRSPVLRTGHHFWVWYESEWRLARSDGEDWDILGWGATVPRNSVLIGARVVDAPTTDPDERTTPPDPQSSSIQS